jgi:23S rRNA (cytidine1920-2'-O)/16S rRNA (cytidine1409-2'-O)-methyltransferase
MKLDGALAELEIEVSGKRWLDAGASTGGFTDRLLQGGATEVAAVDVGYGQLDWGLRNDERVHVLERANVRFMGPQDLPWAPEGVVADLSFISLRLVLPVLQRISTPEADHLLLVKPQFELGRGRVSKGGVVTDPAEWREAVGAVIGSAAEIGLGLVGCAPSMFPGPAGNREFFVHLRAGADGSLSSVDRAIERAP